MGRDSRLKKYRSKGKLYVYHRATGKRIWSELNSQAFWQEVGRLDQKAATIAADKTGTLGELCRAYLQSVEFTAILAEPTRREYSRILGRVEPLYELPVSTFDRDFVLRLRKQMFLKHRTRTANYVLQVLCAVFSWGAPLAYVKSNPFKDVPRFRRAKGVKQPAPTGREVVVTDLMPPRRTQGRQSRLPVDYEKMLSLLDEKEEE